MNNLSKHERFMALLSSGREIPVELSAWYLKAVKEHESSGKALCICLGIRGSGIRSAKTRKIIRHRNVLLYFAVNQCTEYPGDYRLWNHCETLADQVNRWPFSSSENIMLKALFSLKYPIPSTPAGIYRQVKKIANLTPPILRN